jgi:hypothetical protein
MKQILTKCLFIVLFSFITNTTKAADTLRFDLIIIFKTTTSSADTAAFRIALHAIKLDSTFPSRAQLWRCWLLSGAPLVLPGGSSASVTTPSEAVGVICGTGKSDGVGLNGLYIIPEDIRATGNNDTLRGIPIGIQPLLGACADAGTATMHQCAAGDRVVKIAIIDSGVDCDRSPTNAKDIVVAHDSLKFYVCRDSQDSLDGKDGDLNGYIDDLIGYDFVEKDGIPQDGTGHGTFVTGVISRILKANAAPNIKFVTLRALDSTNSGFEFNIIRAVDYAIKKKVQIINGSFVGADRLNDLIDKPLSVAFKIAADSGIIVSVAAGNRSKNVDDSLYSPPSFINENLIVTGGTGCLSSLATFSNFGASSVDILAPATNLYSTWKRTTGTCSTNCYARYSGTSFAAPQTTAVAALLMSKLVPTLTRGSLSKCALLTSATYRTFLNGKARRAGTLNGLGACNIINTVSLPCNERVANEELLDNNLRNFEVAPNPFSDALNLQFSLREATEINVSIISLTGQNIVSESFMGTIGENQHPLSIKAVDGIYFVLIHIGNTVIMRKVVKM